MNYKIIYLALVTFILSINNSYSVDNIASYYLNVTYTETEQSVNSTELSPETSKTGTEDSIDCTVSEIESILNFDKIYNTSIEQKEEHELNNIDIIYCIKSSTLATVVEEEHTIEPVNQITDKEKPEAGNVYWNLSGHDLITSLLANKKIEIMVSLLNGDSYYLYELPNSKKTVSYSRYHHYKVSNIGVLLTENDGVNFTSISSQLGTKKGEFAIYALICSDVYKELKGILRNTTKEKPILVNFIPPEYSIEITEYNKYQ